MGSLIGVDEAGRGPVIGPLVVAGFKISSEDHNGLLKMLGVRDSKKCSPKRREWLAKEIKKLGEYSVKIISADEIDQRRKEQNLNQLEGDEFGEVINRLNPDDDTTIIVDAADANEERFKNYLEKSVKKGHIISKHKADEDYLVVAAASILAKTERDDQVRIIAKELNAEIGSGYPADPITIKFLENWIREKRDLPPHTRRSWKTSEKLLKRLFGSNRTLDEFG